MVAGRFACSASPGRALHLLDGARNAKPSRDNSGARRRRTLIDGELREWMPTNISRQAELE
jgi:hypothetical protein